MIAFHFPPAAMGSGHLRTLGFARYLPASGWEPIVLSANAHAYPRADLENNKLIPDACIVHRALALDVRRHMSLGGKYPGFLAQPDRWASWRPAAIWQGLRLIRRHKIDAIWSTYPIMTAHSIASTLSGITKLPWIADFRDPVRSSVEAGNRFSVSSQHRWERRVLHSATRAVFTTPGAMYACAERYPQAHSEGRLAVIANGYDEAAFVDLPSAPPPELGRPLVLLHSGLLYSEGRNPVPFFTALARLKAAGIVATDNLRVVLRASGSETAYTREIQKLGLEEIVVFAPPVSNHEALIEQTTADALLLFQGGQYDRQIPAKLYEYLRIGRPIFAMLGERGDTAALLRDIGGAMLVPLDDAAVIAEQLSAFIQGLRVGRAPRPQWEKVAKYSRSEGALNLAKLLHQAVTRDSS